VRKLSSLAAALAVACAVLASTSAAVVAQGTRFYTPPPNSGAERQIKELDRAGKSKDAWRLSRMVAQPQAVWLTDGTPAEVRKEVRDTLRDARSKVPVFVAYYVPYRDCAQYSAGGALSTADYKAWIDGLAAGLGSERAIVILEPDGLGIIPYYDPIGGNPMEWCQPTVGGVPAPEADPAHRFEQLNYAVDALGALPNVKVYLDGTHSGWLGSGDAAHRLVQAGVQRADGFFLNVSNYRRTEHLQKYGAWISGCIAFATNPEEGGWRLGHYDWCASQYFPANPNDFSTWHLTDEWYAANLGSARPTTRFVVDTSRNGQGPWTPPAGVYPDPQDWCNPPGRGVGLRPTPSTGVPLIDAYLWIKIPGESDGPCTRGLPGPADPEWGLVDPAAGQWFPEQALELARLADPALIP
jgi:endoglucanase